MKKNTILKVLSLVLLLTVVSVVLLTGCNGQLKEDVAQTKEDVTKTQTDLASAKAALDEASAKIATLQNDLDALTATVENSATSAALTQQVQILNDAIASLQTQLDAAKTDLNAAIATQKATLEATMGTKEADAALQAAIDALEAAAATKAELNTAKTDLNAAISALQTTLNGKISTLETNLATLSGKVTALEGIADALVTPVGLNAYEDVTDLLASVYNEDGSENEYSYVAFKARCESIIAAAYFEEEVQEYNNYVDGLYIRLIRATTIDEVEKVFADLAEYQENLPTIVELFEAELLRLEGRDSTEAEINGIVDTNPDQLDRLENLYNAIDDRQGQPGFEGFEDGQVDRYNDIEAAKDFALGLEDEAAEIAEDACDEFEVEADPEPRVLPAIFEVEDETLKAVDVTFEEDLGERIDLVCDDYDDLADRIANGDEEPEDEEEMARIVALLKEGLEEDLTGYTLAHEMQTRFATLTEAKDALVEVDLEYFPLDTTTEQPLYTDRDAIDADIAAIDEVLKDEQYALDEANYILVLNAAMAEKAEEDAGYEKVTYAFIKAVDEYADRMIEIYETYVDKEEGNVAEALAAELEAGAEGVLYRRIESDLLPLVQALGEVHTAVAAVNTELEQEIDEANIAAMLGLDTDEKKDTFNAIAMRAIALMRTKYLIDEKTAELLEKQGNVNFGDGENILTGYQAELDRLFDVDDKDVYETLGGIGLFDVEGLEGLTLRYWDYNDNQERVIVEGTNYENYLDMTEDFRAALDALLEEYNTLKEKVQAIYDEVKDIVKADDDAVKTLRNLQKILWANRKVSALEGVNTPSFVLNDPDEPNGTITFQRFRGMLTARVLQLVNLAERADAETIEDVDLNNAIAALENFDLNQTEEYKDVLEAVVYWIENYLNINIDEYFGDEYEVEVVEIPTLEEPIEPEEPEEPEAPEEPVFNLVAPVEPDPSLYPDGTQDPDYLQAYALYTNDLEHYNNEYSQYEQDYAQYEQDYAQWEEDHAQWEEDYAQWEEDYAAYEEALADYNDAWEAYYDYVDARADYIRNNMADYILDLFAAVEEVFQNTASTDDDGKLDGKDGYILGIGNYNFPETGDYKFIENFEAVIAAAEDYLTKYANAQKEWFGYTDEETGEYVPGILDDINALPDIADIRIHDDVVDDASDRYAQYVEDFYAGEIVNDQFDELEAYDAAQTEEDLMGKKADLEAKRTAATNLYNTIIAQAYDLINNYNAVPADEDIDAIFEKVAALRANIEFYRNTYCPGNTDKCEDQCHFVDGTIDAELVGYKMQAKAQIVKVIVDGIYLEEIDYLDTTYHIDEVEDRKTLKRIFCESIDMKSTIEYVISDYELFFGLMVDPAKVEAPEIPEEPGDEPQAPDENDYDMDNEEEADAYYQAYDEWETVLLPAYQQAVADYQAYQDDPTYFDELAASYAADAVLYALYYLYPIA